MSAPGTPLLRIGHIIYGLFVWVVFIPITLLTIVVLVVTPGESRRRRITKASARLVLALSGIPLEVSGMKNVPEEGCVLVANHASYLDGLVLTAALPPRFHFVIKGEMQRVPLVNVLLRRIGAEFVNRFDPGGRTAAARRLIQLAASGHSLAFFPEGTFTSEPGLRHFHNGAFAAALRGDMPVVPVVINGTRSMLPSDQWLPVPGKVKVIVKPTVISRALDDPIPGMIKTCRQSILEDLEEPDLV